MFEEAQYSVTTIQSPSEGGFVSGGGIFTHGQEASLQAIPADGYLFYVGKAAILLIPLHLQLISLLLKT